MLLFSDGDECKLSNDDKASAINLAFFLDVTNYNKHILKQVSEIFTEKEKEKIYAFWKETSEVSARAYLCMAEFERRI